MAYPEYYNELEVSPSADMAEIKKAYRKLVKKYHPDLNPGNKTAERKLKKINEAYEVLKDFAKRAEYDYFGKQQQQVQNSQQQAQTYSGTKTRKDEHFSQEKTVEISWRVLWFRRLFALCILAIYMAFLFSNADKENPYDWGKMLSNSGRLVGEKIASVKDVAVNFNRADWLNKLLFKSVKHDWLFVLRSILKVSPDVNATDEKGYSLLMYAQSLAAAEMLREHGANLKYIAPDRETAYSQAIKNKKAEVIDFFVREGAQIRMEKPRRVIRPETWKRQNP